MTAIRERQCHLCKSEMMKRYSFNVSLYVKNLKSQACNLEFVPEFRKAEVTGVVAPAILYALCAYFSKDYSKYHFSNIVNVFALVEKSLNDIFDNFRITLKFSKHFNVICSIFLCATNTQTDS